MMCMNSFSSMNIRVFFLFYNWHSMYMFAYGAFYLMISFQKGLNLISICANHAPWPHMCTSNGVIFSVFSAIPLDVVIAYCYLHLNFSDSPWINIFSCLSVGFALLTVASLRLYLPFWLSHSCQFSRSLYMS